MSARLVLFGNVLLDCTYDIENFPAILAKHGLKSDELGERNMAQLASMKKDADEK